MAVSDRDKTGRKQDGTFAPGSSGNPAGRPRGARSVTTRMLAELVDGEGELIVRKLIDLAKEGDPVALRLAVERLLPRVTDRRVEIDLARVEGAKGVAGAIASVIEFAASGELSLEEARAFLALLEGQRKAIETVELADRVGELEDAQAREYGFPKED